jgi:hypothetical protein
MNSEEEEDEDQFYAEEEDEEEEFSFKAPQLKTSFKHLFNKDSEKDAPKKSFAGFGGLQKTSLGVPKKEEDEPVEKFGRFKGKIQSRESSRDTRDTRESRDTRETDSGLGIDKLKKKQSVDVSNNFKKLKNFGEGKSEDIHATQGTQGTQGIQSLPRLQGFKLRDENKVEKQKVQKPRDDTPKSSGSGDDSLAIAKVYSDTISKLVEKFSTLVDANTDKMMKMFLKSEDTINNLCEKVIESKKDTPQPAAQSAHPSHDDLVEEAALKIIGLLDLRYQNVTIDVSTEKGESKTYKSFAKLIRDLPEEALQITEEDQKDDDIEE